MKGNCLSKCNNNCFYIYFNILKASLTILSCLVLILSHCFATISGNVISVGILSNLPVFLFFFLISIV
nr:hypothetical protein CoNPh37_CDS0157 [Staphylococcus phage S-CoN_Ph37]